MEYWLDRLLRDIEYRRPFSVLGSVYTGSNWDSFSDNEVPAPLRRHLNGNAVYNVSHPFLTEMLSRFNEESWRTAKHSSFDVELSEVIFRDNNASMDVAAQVYGYKTTPLISNLAATLTLPRDIADTAILVHGAVYLQEWPRPGCPRAERTAYPQKMLSANANTSLSLLVSDFGNGGIDRLLASLLLAEEHLAHQSCAGSSLPFSRIVVSTHDEASAAKVTRSFLTASPRGHHFRLCPSALRFTGNQHGLGSCDDSFGVPVEVEVRDTRQSAWWDICRANISTEWFMQVTSDFTLVRNFKLPVDTDTTATQLLPVNPFLDFDSQYCGRECREEVERVRAAILPTANRHYMQAHTVYRTDIASEFCDALEAANTRLLDPVDPTPTAYFAYMQRVIGDLPSPFSPALSPPPSSPPPPPPPPWPFGSSSLAVPPRMPSPPPALPSQSEPLCAGQPDPPRCDLKVIRSACSRQDAVGRHFRRVCRLACDTCAPEDFQIGESTRERWSALWTYHTRDDGTVYMLYDQQRYFFVKGLVGSASPPPCEDSADYTACPCRFPFFHDNEYRTECAIMGESPYLTCPTSLPNVRPSPVQHPSRPSSSHAPLSSGRPSSTRRRLVTGASARKRI